MTKPNWLKVRTVRCPLPVAPHELQTRTLYALCLAEYSGAWTGVTTVMSAEQSLLFRFWHYPTDAYFLRLCKVFTLSKPLLVKEALTQSFVRCGDGVYRERCGSYQSVRPASTTWPYFPRAEQDLNSLTVLTDIGTSVLMSVRDVLSLWECASTDAADVMVLPMPATVAHLATRKLWKDLVCLGRWPEFTSLLPDNVQTQVGLVGASPPRPEFGSLDLPACNQVLHYLKTWAPLILANFENDDLEEQRLQLEYCITWLQNVSSNLPEMDCLYDPVFQKLNGRVYSSLFMVKVMLLTQLVPSSVNLKKMFVETISLLFPNLMSNVCQDLIRHPNVVPVKSQRHFARLLLDAALLLWRRQESGRFVRFGGSDSSPQCGFDFLLSSCDFISEENVRPLFQRVLRMIEECETRKQAGDTYEQSAESADDHAFLRKHLRKEDFTLAALGNQASSVPHKCSALLDRFWLRCASQFHLSEYRRSFFSFCSDMGTEINVAGFRINEVQELLLPWLQTVDLHSDVGAYDDNGDDMNLESDVAAVELEVGMKRELQIIAEVPDDPVKEDGADGECLLPNAFSVPGILHVVNNSLKELSTKLRYFEKFFPSSKALKASGRQAA
jgi:hypothetical protein